jgi:hypothetical protein
LAVRLLSVFIGTATVALLYLTGRRLLGVTAGVLAAALLAISPFHVYYSQEVRMYGLVTLYGLAALYLTLGNGWIVGRVPWAVWLGYVLAATAALYTQYYAAFLLLGLNLVVLIRWRRLRCPVRALLPWFGAQLGVLALYLPWVWYAGGKLATYVRFKVGAEGDLSLGFFPYLARHLAAFNWGHAEGVLAGWAWLGLLPLAILALSLVLPARQARPAKPSDRLPIPSPALWAAVIVAVILFCGFLVNLTLPFNPPRSERLLLLALPAYLLVLTAMLLAALRRRPWLGAVALASLLAVALGSLAVFYTVPRYPGDDYRPLIARVRALGLPSDAVLCVHPWQVGFMQAYIPDEEVRPTLVLTPREVLPSERQLWADDPALMSEELDALLKQHGRLWLPAHQAMGRVLENRINAYLVGHSYPALSEWYGENTVLSLFAAGRPVPVPVTAQFGDWLTLQGVALSPGPMEAGWGIVATDLTWVVSDPPSEPYQIGLRMRDGAGWVWAQHDSPPLAGLVPFSEWPVGEPQVDRHGLLVPAGTPPGEYQVTLRVYRSEDTAVLPVTFEGGSGGEVTLGTVRVVRPESPPPVEALDIEQPLEVDLYRRPGHGADPELRFLGFSLSGGPVLQPGETIEVELFWQALAAPGEDWMPRLQLVDADGNVVAEKTEKPVMGGYPTAWWHAGELVRDPHVLPIPARVPPGSYRLTVSLIRAADGLPAVTEDGDTAVDLTGIEVQGREHQYVSPAPAHVQAARLGSSVELIGYNLSEAAVAPGSALEVTLYWHALETPDKAYHAFVHLLDAKDKIVAQHDGPAGQGALPTLGWLPGEYLADPHVLTLPAGLPEGDYRLRVGLYDPATGQRLGGPIHDGDRVLLDTPIFVKREE